MLFPMVYLMRDPWQFTVEALGDERTKSVLKDRMFSRYVWLYNGQTFVLRLFFFHLFGLCRSVHFGVRRISAYLATCAHDAHY